MKTVTAFVAAAGLIMPEWLPTVAEVSGHAATLVPIASLVWLVTQIIRAWRGK